MKWIKWGDDYFNLSNLSISKDQEDNSILLVQDGDKAVKLKVCEHPHVKQVIADGVGTADEVFGLVSNMIISFLSNKDAQIVDLWTFLGQIQKKTEEQLQREQEELDKLQAEQEEKVTPSLSAVPDAAPEETEEDSTPETPNSAA